MGGVTNTIEKERKDQKGGFLGKLLGTLCASLLENVLVEKGKTRVDKGTTRVGHGF